MKSSLICLLLLAAVTCAAPPAGEAKMANMFRMANMAKMAEVAKVSHDEAEEVSGEVAEAEMAEVVYVAEMVDVINWAEGAADAELEAWAGSELGYQKINDMMASPISYISEESINSYEKTRTAFQRSVYCIFQQCA
ncbi:hypothetical protein FHG87_021655 [Trinorchestia longiramus]|nr:hypothetical protein FHG87_021655 [Trinorchestia longiramus]